MRIGILCHGDRLPLWQAQAVRRIAEGHEIYLLTCEPPPSSPRRAKHFGYYLLNLAAIRNRLTRSIPFPAKETPVAGSFRFQAAHEGAWAVLPDDLLKWVRDQRLDAIVKFGLGLLRVPDASRLSAPILSYHHGDPRTYRGRPAGFYELLRGERFMGQVVQIISNALDQGEVLAFAESKVVPHSYRKTLLEAYRLSPYLLPEALRMLAARRRVPLEPHGPNYRLPANGTVFRFILGRARRLAGRLLYGAFVEKCWEVASAPLGDGADPAAAVLEAESRRAQWQIAPRLRPYSFYADPFFHSGVGDIFVEAMNARSGKGELVRIGADGHRRLGGFDGHVSYPGAVEEGGKLYLLPEISEWSPQALYEVDAGQLRRVAALDIDAPRLLDPTMARLGDRLFLFANSVEDGPSVLHLWSAPSLFARFERHPASPVRVSARGSRMAGELVRMDGELYRLGQDFRDSYGDGIMAFRIDAIDTETYREEPSGEAAFRTVRGPHTVNFRDGTLLFDWYVDRPAPLAGVRRLLHRL